MFEENVDKKLHIRFSPRFFHYFKIFFIRQDLFTQENIIENNSIVTGYLISTMTI